jgi:thymidylate synthase
VNFKNFRTAYDAARFQFSIASQKVPAHIWQGVDVRKKPEMVTHELEDYYFSFPIATEDLDYHRAQIGPNNPWADRHFELDRVSGEPLNPGVAWAEWPYALKADGFRDEHGQFNHSYAERYWPKLAGRTPGGYFRGTIFDETCGDYQGAELERERRQLLGIRYRYGDLSDVVRLLVRNPLTRNAYLPVWFPEDTGVVHGGRTPCSIGYLFRMRGDKLSVFYDIRSCDFVRHFQDDVYLTIRLLLWVLAQARSQDKKWDAIKPGTFTMHIGSFHIFAADWQGVMT